MKFGFSGEAFGNLIVLNAFLGLILGGIIFIIAHKRGIDITTRRFQLTVGISLLFMLVVIPLLLSDASVKWKIIIAIAALAGGIGNYFGVDMMQRILRGKFGDKKGKERREP